MPARAALVLLQHPQRHAEDDPARRDRASPALGIGAFAEKTLVAAGQCTKVDPSASAAVVGLLGCGVMAGLGAAINTGGVSRGDTVAVFGCGGVGNAAIAGSLLAGARTIIAVDIDDRKLEWAREFGATHTINSPTTDPVAAIKEITGVRRRRDHRRRRATGGVPAGLGRPRPRGHDRAGRRPEPAMLVDAAHRDLRRGGSIKSSWYGDCLPSRDFPMLVDLHQQGRLPLDKFVSETIALDQVEEAFHKMERGEVLRSVVVF